MDIPWSQMSEKAWNVRENSVIFSKTKVGSAVLSESQNIYSGCNIQQTYRSHDIHAEVNAICNMISGGDKIIKAILIVAERDLFTPCGACMDWIIQFGEVDCIVGFQNTKGGEIIKYTTKELMPYYPR
jgi:cytidine deaminase